MSDDVERVRVALWGIWLDNYTLLSEDELRDLAQRVLAAIRAAANHMSWDMPEKMWEREWRKALDAALAALTDHPGGIP